MADRLAAKSCGGVWRGGRGVAGREAGGGEGRGCDKGGGRPPTTEKTPAVKQKATAAAGGECCNNNALTSSTHWGKKP